MKFSVKGMLFNRVVIVYKNDEILINLYVNNELVGGTKTDAISFIEGKPIDMRGGDL